MTDPGFPTIFAAPCTCCGADDCEQAMTVIARDKGAVAVFVDVPNCLILDRAAATRLRDALSKHLGEGEK